MIATSIEKLDQCLRERIVVLDGAMGTVIQQHQLDEAAYRGERFRDWPKDLKGNHDVLNLTQPQVVEEIHRQYLEAGADIIETNTFNSQAISLADYRMEALAYELAKAGADCARRAADAVMSAQPGRLCVVAGAIGPTTRTSSISTDVNNSAARATTFDELVAAYYDQGRGLMDGGVDALLVETIFDTLNAKAAFFALEKLFEERRVRLPLMEELAGLAPTYLSSHPNAGLPNPLLPTGFPETPETFAPQLRKWAEDGWLNIVGGCCGTTPAHIQTIAQAVRGLPPRRPPRIEA